MTSDAVFFTKFTRYVVNSIVVRSDYDKRQSKFCMSKFKHLSDCKNSCTEAFPQQWNLEPAGSPENSTSTASVAPRKRGVGCSQINAISYGSYQLGDSTFTILCDTNWHAVYILQLSFTADFVSCMNACLEWNMVQSDECVGVTWAAGSYGPAGPAGGSVCVFRWTMPGTGSYQLIGSDSAQLQGVSSPNV